MKRIVTSFALMAAALGPGLAHAENFPADYDSPAYLKTLSADNDLPAGSTVTGSIKQLKPHAHAVILDGGQSYWMSRKVNLSKFRVGERVIITYQTKHGRNLGSRLLATS